MSCRPRTWVRFRMNAHQIGCLFLWLSSGPMHLHYPVSPVFRRLSLTSVSASGGPYMLLDIREFVAACPTCASCKVSNRTALGHPLPLPILQCPLSHIAIDFVTGLPPSGSNKTILTLVDHSKMVHFIAGKFTLGKEMAKLMLHHAFSRFPGGCGLKQRPTVHLLFLEGFCNLVRAAVSLSSRYHLQPSG